MEKSRSKEGLAKVKKYGSGYGVGEQLARPTDEDRGSPIPNHKKMSVGTNNLKKKNKYAAE